MDKKTLPMANLESEQPCEPSPRHDQLLQGFSPTKPYTLKDSDDEDKQERSNVSLLDSSKHSNPGKTAVSTTSRPSSSRKVYRRRQYTPGSEEETKLKVIHAIEKNWGKGFITKYITKCHCPHQKTTDGKRMWARRQYVTGMTFFVHFYAS